MQGGGPPKWYFPFLWSGRDSFTPARGFTAAGLMLALGEPPSQTAARRNPARADVSLRQAENLSFSRLPGSNFRLFWAITLQLLPVPAWRAACARGTGQAAAGCETNARMGVLVMNAPERKEFFYSRAWAILMGGLLFLTGAAFLALLGGDLLRHGRFGWTPSNWWLYGLLILSIAIMIGGLLVMSNASDRRPVLVLDSEGLFYRPHGNGIVPWRDILAVELDDRDSEFSSDLILTRQSGPRLSIELMELWPNGGSGGKHVAHRAILEAWEAACARGAGPAAAGCETNTRMGGMVMNDPERKKFFPPRFPRIFFGGLSFLGGSACVLAPSLLLLGFREFPYAAPLGKFLAPDFTANCGWMILIGLIMLALGLWALWEGLDWRPKLVVDSEGVFYRSDPNVFVPWRDIRAVELDRRTRGGTSINVDDKRFFLVRDSGLPVKIEGLGASAYRAVARAWERHGGKA